MKTTFHNTLHPKKRAAILSKKARVYSRMIHALERKNTYVAHESALLIGNDEKYQKNIAKSLARFGRVKHVVLVGIGGSSLGTEAVYHALAFKTNPQLLVLDAIERDSTTQLTALFDTIESPADIAIVIVSKSGTTTETMTNAGVVLELYEKKFNDSTYAQCIFIGDRDTPFWKIGKKKKILCFSIPEKIGGRYSVFSAVGIVPLTLLGIDTISLREGVRAACTTEALAHAEERAVTLALQAESGVHTVNFFTFNERLAVCGQWYRQLLAESIGKPMTIRKTTFSHQLLPIVSTSIDLHSMAQLYLGGYKNMYTHFVGYDETQIFHQLTKHWILAHLPFLQHAKVEHVKRAITQSVLGAYDEQKLPYCISELEKCSAYEIGYLLTTLMYETMCLAHLLNVDAFTQPSVESYKKHHRENLQ